MDGSEPTWLSLLPPLLAIGGALLFKRVVPALAIGVLVGAAMLHGLAAPLRFFDRYLWHALTDSGHQWILALALFLGGMIRVISRSEIAISMAGGLTRYATDRRRGQVTAWALGLLFFFDDYVNTLFVGSTMGSVRQRLRISREKLAFVVDATAAPVASLAPISTWIATEIAYIDDQVSSLGIDADAFGLFLRSLPSRYYSWLMLATVLMVALTNRDLGPMRRAERAAAAATIDPPRAAQGGEAQGRIGWLLAWTPILLVLVTVTAGVLVTGYLGASAGGDAITPVQILNNAESSKVMVLGALLGGLAAVVIAARGREHGSRAALRLWGAGSASMVEVMAVLLLAWALGDLCREDLNTAGFLVSALGPGFDAGFLPAMVFLVSAVTSFATGTSWGTMGIVFPLAIPMAHQLAPGDETVLLTTISSILAGSVFGDHCSPISDTTIMSAMATECDHIAHVRTQLPYALLVAGVSVVFGCIPVGLGLWSAWLGLLVGAVAMLLIIFAVAKPVEDAATAGR